MEITMENEREWAAIQRTVPRRWDVSDPRTWDRATRQRVREWIRWIEHDPAAPVERRAWWRTFAMRVEEQPVPDSRRPLVRLALARSLARCPLPMPVTWEALVHAPDRHRYWAWVYPDVELRWMREAGIWILRRGWVQVVPVPVLAGYYRQINALRSLVNMAAERWLPPLWWEREPDEPATEGGGA